MPRNQLRPKVAGRRRPLRSVILSVMTPWSGTAVSDTPPYLYRLPPSIVIEVDQGSLRI